MASEDIPGLKKFPGPTEFPWQKIGWQDARDTFIGAVDSLSLTQSLLLFAVALSLLGFVLMVRRSRNKNSGAAGNQCRWKKDRWRHGSIKFDRWICRECGVEAFSGDGRPPKECKRHLRKVTL